MDLKLIIDRVDPNDKKTIDLIASWYQEEWNIPLERTNERLTNFNETGIPFHLIVKQNGIAVATGGLYTDSGIGLLITHPEYKKYPYWIALVYTLPEFRGRGIAAELCRKIESIAKTAGNSRLHLYTNTAEKLYLREGWKPLEWISYHNLDTVIMEKEL